MLTTLVAAIAVSATAPDFAKTTITGATIFRNGYGFVVTETWLNESGTTLIRALPQAVEGTLWFAPGKYAEINDITVTMMDVDPIVENAETIPEIIALNTGKTVTVRLVPAHEKEAVVLSGTILSIWRSQFLLQTATGIRAVNFNAVESLDGQFEDFKTSAETNVSAPVLRVQSKPGAGGSIYTISLVDGIAWLPSYSIDLKDAGQLELSMKAAVLNSLGDFEKVDIGLMSGFPKIDSLGERSPLTSGLQMLMEATQNSNRLAMVRGQQSYGGQLSGYGGGGSTGFRQIDGQEGLAPSNIRPVQYDPTDNSFIVAGTDKALGELDDRLRAIERENFFIYGIDDYEHKLGDRKYLVIDDGDLNYELSHRINSSSGNSEVQARRYVEFENGLDVPLTKASAMITRDGELIGKTELPYTYMGDKVELDIGTAPYMLTEVSTNLIKTNKGELKLRDKRIFDEIEQVDTITVTNLSKQPAKTLLHHRLRGEVFQVSLKALESKTSTSDSVNFDYLLEWEIEVAPGETRTFKIEYSSYRLVRTDK